MVVSLISCDHTRRVTCWGSRLAHVLGTLHHRTIAVSFRAVVSWRLISFFFSLSFFMVNPRSFRTHRYLTPSTVTVYTYSGVTRSQQVTLTGSVGTSTLLDIPLDTVPSIGAIRGLVHSCEVSPAKHPRNEAEPPIHELSY